ncbi:MAG TPA: class I SAM-dependent methyltransferase [Actinomycetota bacterium]|nr:class I SAM-dependent methyltransferase [Actinomycetota bacterium]
MAFDFGRVSARDYEELRPGYAPEAVAWVVERARLGTGTLVVDLGAGTGQLSRRFTTWGVQVIAVEPAPNMRRVLGETLPTIRALPGTAEEMPLSDASTDAVVVGNAFHHFDADRAAAEIGRVLRPGGALALFWAASDPDEHRLDAIAGVAEASVEASPTASVSSTVAAYRAWSRSPSTLHGFSTFERRSFPSVHAIRSSRIADLFATSSDVASLEPDRRVALQQRIRELARGLPNRLELSARTNVDLAFRTPGMPRRAGGVSSRRGRGDVDPPLTPPVPPRPGSARSPDAPRSAPGPRR